MSALAFTSSVHKPPYPPLCRTCTAYQNIANGKTKTRVSVRSSLTSQAITSDPFVLELAETLEDSLPSSSSPPLPLQKLREVSSESLLSTQWPSRKDEPFCFTDISFIRHSEIRPVVQLPDSSCLLGISVNTQFPYLVIEDDLSLTWDTEMEEW